VRRARLDGYVWHSNRHTVASRLVMAGVDLRTVQELGGWRSLAMVQKHAHLAPGHRLAAVEALVTEATTPDQPVRVKLWCALRESNPRPSDS
jgi:integrase